MSFLYTKGLLNDGMIQNLNSHEKNNTNCEHEGGSWDPGKNVAALTFALMLAIFLIMFINGLRNYCENRLKKSNTYVLHIVKHFYREIMCLGLVSFLLFVLEQFHFSDFLVSITKVEHDGETYNKIFEFVHMLLFAIVLLYVLIIIFITYLAKHILKEFNGLDNITLGYQKVQEEYLLIKSKEMKRSWYDFGFWRNKGKVAERLTYYLWKNHVEEIKGLKSQIQKDKDDEKHDKIDHSKNHDDDHHGKDTDHFGLDHSTQKEPETFKEELLQSLSTICVELAELHKSVWFLFLALLTANLIRYSFIEIGGPWAALQLWILGAISAIVVVALYIRTKKIKYLLLREWELENNVNQYLISDHENVSEHSKDNDLEEALVINENAKRTDLDEKIEQLASQHWFKSPIFHLRILQIFLLLQPCYFAASVYYSTTLEHNQWQMIIYLAPSFVVFAFILPILRNITLVHNAL